MRTFPLSRSFSRRAARIGLGGRLGLVLAVFGLLLRLAVPGISALPAVAPWTGLQDILGDVAVAICSHAGESTSQSDDPARPAPRHRPGHDCIACCSPASLAAVLPLDVSIPLPSESSTVEPAALTSAGPALSIYAVRQRGPPVPPTA